MIENYKVIYEDEDLYYTPYMAYQKDRTKTIEYSHDYFNKYVGLKNTAIAKKLNGFRTSITENFCKKNLLDVGIGSGEFITNSKLKVYGYDINPYGIQWLQERDLYIDIYKEDLSWVEGITLWDTLEHMPNPYSFISLIKDQYVFVSIPIFNNLSSIKSSKHYKPNEHYYYFTKSGLIQFMKDSGLQCLEATDAEVKCGREGISSFVFKK